MQFLTSLVLAAFVGYAGSWYLGFIEGNFALLLFMATVITGVYWLAERFVFLPRRQQAAEQLEIQAAQRRLDLRDQHDAASSRRLGACFERDVLAKPAGDDAAVLAKRKLP